MKCVAGVATENFCRFGKNIYKSHTQKMHTHTHTNTQIQSKMRALFMATEIFYSPSEIVKCLTYICPVFQGNDKKKHKGECKKKCK